MSTPPSSSPAAPGDGGGDGSGRHTSSAPTCPRHPDRVSYIRCQRCERPVCPDCQRPAAVGVQCVDCVKEGARTVPTPRTRFGAVASTGGTPYVTWTLLGLCVLVFAGQLASPALTRELSFVGVLAGAEPWRFLTSAFVHSPSSFLHIAFNMYILYAFGPLLERLLGPVKFLVIYLLCAVGGSVGVLLLAPPDPGWFVQVVGASGAIFGLLLLHVVVSLRSGQSPTPLLVMIGLNLALPFFVSNIAWQAHIGGAVTGAAIGGLLALTSAPGRTAEAARRRRWMWPALGALALLLAAVAVWRLVQVLGPSAFTPFTG
ncbi:rhomboid family intramembrane serine protease [Ornithinimicrobium cerasi]|uniref:rhomboid family intramembrane serine protease n=1 Tax=Ornithinimicrobium cerasi TaxID=2248773 RepID=UPI000EFE28B2|nr:rhomboid family intramembrane serine protease [Ornithinimicrobium cerasi]